MALRRVELTDLQQTIAVVDGDGRPTPLFLRFINGAISSLKNGVNSLIDVQNAVAAANAAAASANAAAATAQAAADTAQAAVDATASVQSIALSYIAPSSVLTASPTDITVASHSRFYADGSFVNVLGDVVNASAIGDTDYVYYDDPTHAGGAVTYQVSTTAPIQSADRHVVGAVVIPSVGTATGGKGPVPPGYVQP